MSDRIVRPTFSTGRAPAATEHMWITAAIAFGGVGIFYYSAYKIAELIFAQPFFR